MSPRAIGLWALAYVTWVLWMLGLIGKVIV